MDSQMRKTMFGGSALSATATRRAATPLACDSTDNAAASSMAAAPVRVTIIADLVCGVPWRKVDVEGC